MVGMGVGNASLHGICRGVKVNSIEVAGGGRCEAWCISRVIAACRQGQGCDTDSAGLEGNAQVWERWKALRLLLHKTHTCEGN